MKFKIGRLGRPDFVAAILTSFIVVFLLVIFNIPQQITLTFVFVNFAWMVVLYIGRLHDTGHSGWYSLLIMLTSILGIVVLASWAGDKGINKYGDVPPRTLSHLFYFWRTKKL